MSLSETSAFAPFASDARARLPGDDLLPDASLRLTHHVDIDAPPKAVWPWLVQMGRRRGGWYSWDLLDNGGAPSADHIIPELQSIAVGDVWPIKASGADGFTVLALEPERALVLGDPSLLPGRAPAAGSPLRGTWAFSLEQTADGGTHLVTRVRIAYQPSLKMALLVPLLRAVHDFMQRKQLRTLKRRVEATRAADNRRARRDLPV